MKEGWELVEDKPNSLSNYILITQGDVELYSGHYNGGFIPVDKAKEHLKRFLDIFNSGSFTTEYIKQKAKEVFGDRLISPKDKEENKNV